MKQTRDMLVRLFSVSELRDLCLAMGFAPDDFPQGLSAFARELVLHIDRLDLWASFAKAAKEARPRADWSYLDARPAKETAAVVRPRPGQDGNDPAIPAAAAAAPKTLRQHAKALVYVLAALPDWDTEPERRAFLIANDLEGIEGGCELSGSRRDAALSLLSAILRFKDADPWFTADSLATLYEAAAATTGLFSAPKRAELEREATVLRQR